MTKIPNDEAVVRQPQQVPLHELLAKVPADARLVIEDADGFGTSFIPVGKYCQEAATVIRQALADAALDKMADNARELGLSYEQEPVADDRLALIAHNIDPGDWNDLGFRDSWYRGFRAGFREAENEHNIRMEK